MKRFFTLEYWQDDSWFVGKLKEIPGVFSQGQTVEELKENIIDAYHMMLQEYEQQFYSFMESKYSEIFMELREKKEISEDFDNRIKAALTEFDSVFQPTTGEAL